MLANAEILEKLGTELKERYQDRLIRLVLFGSQARGDADSLSDIYVLVVLRGNVDALTEIKANSRWLSDFCLETEQLVNCLYLSDMAFEQENTALLRNIRQEGVLL